MFMYKTTHNVLCIRFNLSLLGLYYLVQTIIQIYCTKHKV